MGAESLVQNIPLYILLPIFIFCKIMLQMYDLNKRSVRFLLYLKGAIQMRFIIIIIMSYKKCKINSVNMNRNQRSLK